MGLSSDLISQFVKATNDSEKTTKKETTTYGTTVLYNGKLYVRLDGAKPEQLTPVITTADALPNERVTVMIKNHSAVITGNTTSPSARSGDVGDVASKISEFEIVLAYRVTATDLEAVNATIDELRARVATFDNMTAVDAEIVDLKAKFATLTYVNADTVTALNADIESIRGMFGSFADLTTDDLEALNADIDTLRGYTADFTYVSADVLRAIKAQIDELDVERLDAIYANIDFANIGNAAIEHFFAKSGLIEDVVVGDQTITGKLVGVTISGDRIEGNTVIAEKLVIKGEDGLYYKLNTDGVTTEAEQTDENSLNGSVIKAKSITATKIAVDDLVAFDATIGGFNITDGSIYSGVKETIDNTTRGIYFDSEGQMYLGDADNFLKYYRDDEGNYKLEISAESILFGSNSKSSVSDLKAVAEHVRVSTYTDPETGDVNPSIELAEGDSEFKQVITNKKVMIMDGSEVRTEMDGEGVSTDNITVKNELRHGQWLWQTRSNGNYGLSWKG